jgi:hypothetical protein
MQQLFSMLALCSSSIEQCLLSSVPVKLDSYSETDTWVPGTAIICQLQRLHCLKAPWLERPIHYGKFGVRETMVTVKIHQKPNKLPVSSFTKRTKHKKCHKNIHWNDNLEARKLVFDAITAPSPANVDVLVLELPFIPTKSMEHSSSLEASYKTAIILWNLKFHYPCSQEPTTSFYLEPCHSQFTLIHPISLELHTH